LKRGRDTTPGMEELEPRLEQRSREGGVVKLRVGEAPERLTDV